MREIHGGSPLRYVVIRLRKRIHADRCIFSGSGVVDDGDVIPSDLGLDGVVVLALGRRAGLVDHVGVIAVRDLHLATLERLDGRRIEDRQGRDHPIAIFTGRLEHRANRVLRRVGRVEHHRRVVIGDRATAERRERLGVEHFAVRAVLLTSRPVRIAVRLHAGAREARLDDHRPIGLAHGCRQGAEVDTTDAHTAVS